MRRIASLRSLLGTGRATRELNGNWVAMFFDFMESFTMLPIVTLAILGGILVGQRLKILALLMASYLGLLLTIDAEALLGNSVWSIGLSALAAVVCLQLGYFLGLALRSNFLSADVRVPRRSLVRGFFQ